MQRRPNKLAIVAAAAAAAMPAAAQAPAVTPQFLYGRWTDVSDCSNAIDIHSSGTWVTTTGAQGRWTLQGGRITFIGQRTITARITALNANAIRLDHDDGSVGNSRRCVATWRLL